uniref:Tc1-like transposase DDE domain-containing protein n=1 Tax=Oryzias latipes TaxID=8090 RepID=A0A3P9K994_ORYLA
MKKFMDDDAPLHPARIVKAGLQEVGVPHMVWPALSPDLNPVGHGLDQLKQRLDDHTASPSDLAEPAFVEEWNASEQQHEASEELSSGHYSKWWKYPQSMFVIWGYLYYLG